MMDRCSHHIDMHVRDRNRNVGWMVCVQHLDWGRLQVSRLGYQPVIVYARGTMAGNREWTSGCECPANWKADVLHA